MRGRSFSISSTLVSGTDYSLDAGAGIITFLRQVTLSATGVGLVAYYSLPTVAAKSYKAISEAFVRGTAHFVLFDQNNAANAPKQVWDFAAELKNVEGGEHDGKKWNAFVEELLCLGNPVGQFRE